ncbi:MAG: hypothetical protein BEN19_04120 [Epulopiscium sp. Nuni2H_MBin003]|nr:MAG: hypothetical protein BEN19_04120 [Epulopiscium sp. Nuni2H_MBin003]
MIGLLKKDLLAIYRGFGIFFIGILLAPLTGVSGITAIALILVAVMPMLLMELDNNSGWDKMLATLPLNKTQIVLSKYFISYVLALPMGLLSLLSTKILPLFDIYPSINYTTLIVTICGALTFMSINNLILYIFGVTKGKIAYAIFFALFYLISRFLLDSEGMLENLQTIIINIDEKLIFVVLGTFIINLVSIIIAVVKVKLIK